MIETVMRLRAGLTAVALTAIAIMAVAALATSQGVAAAAPPAAPAAVAGPTAVATFAAGCFWCVESDFEKVPGVVKAVSGFMGGTSKNPTYEQVSAGGTGYAEAVEVTYDPAKVSYDKLLDYYWHHVDLVDGSGQFCDRGDQYRPVIFTYSPEQQKAAEKAKTAINASKRFSQPVAVQIVPAGPFTAAEEYHQHYHEKNPIRYKIYRLGCGRDARLEALWGSDTAAVAH